MKTEPYSPMLDWKVLHVKPRCEKKMADYCRAHGIDAYLPLREVTKIVQRHKRRIPMPIFNGYIFCTFPSSKRLTLLQSNMIVKILAPQRSSLLARELVMIRRALRIQPELNPEPALCKGMRVKILAGPFMGIEGVVEKLASKMRVILNIEMIGQSVAVSAQADQVQVLEQ